LLGPACAAQEPTYGRFAATIPNVGSWSSRVSRQPKVLARKLTFRVSSNQAAAKLLVVTASNMPIAAAGGCEDQSFVSTPREADADAQAADSFSWYFGYPSCYGRLPRWPSKYLGINLLLTRSRHVHTLSMYMIEFLEEKWQRQLLNELWSKQL
jgi:hypothetical protein